MFGEYHDLILDNVHKIQTRKNFPNDAKIWAVKGNKT